MQGVSGEGEQRLPDAVSAACFAVYGTLSAKARPRIRSNGQPEWTVLAGIVLQRAAEHNDPTFDLQVISLGTGVKCLPATRLPLCGELLHDSHAEIVARRGFVLWMYKEIAKFRQDANTSKHLEYASPGDQECLRLKPDYHVLFYVSTLPCGDASVEHLAASQADEDRRAFARSDVVHSSTSLLRGRMGFQHTAALRTKPARPDAFATESLSCSDKLACYTYLGIQGALLSKLIQPIYISTYVFGGISQTRHMASRAAVERALVARLGPLPSCGSYALHPPAIMFTSLAFVTAKDSVDVRHTESMSVPASESVSWICGGPVTIIAGGLRQGSNLAKGGKQPRKTWTPISQAALFESYLQLAAADTDKTLLRIKQSASGYQSAKENLRGKPSSPFKEWLISRKELQMYTASA